MNKSNHDNDNTNDESWAKEFRISDVLLSSIIVAFMQYFILYFIAWLISFRSS